MSTPPPYRSRVHGGSGQVIRIAMSKAIPNTTSVTMKFSVNAPSQWSCSSSWPRSNRRPQLSQRGLIVTHDFITRPTPQFGQRPRRARAIDVRTGGVTSELRELLFDQAIDDGRVGLALRRL